MSLLLKDGVLLLGAGAMEALMGEKHDRHASLRHRPE